MRTKTWIAIILIAIGIIALAYHGITYTTREKVVDLGPLQVTAKERKRIPLPPVVGVLAIIGGTVLLIMERERR